LHRVLLAGAFSLGVVCAVTPWTLRNCEKLGACTVISANGGWNLLIGTFEEGRGAWTPIAGERVPEGCREVFDEVGKDRCFARAARRRIQSDFGAWLGLLPQKLRVTFDYAGAASAYLKEAGTFTESGFVLLRNSEQVAMRLMLVGLGLFWAALPTWIFRQRFGFFVLGKTRAALRAVWMAAFGLAAGCFPWCFAVVAPVYGLTLKGARQQPTVLWWIGVLGSLVAVHGVFFGAARYAMPALLLEIPLSSVGFYLFARQLAVARRRSFDSEG
ncbi:MAG: hypothetical protein MK135_13595, partial [Polyangiaceae bacterium]|nr:hypothetical protein [Polyangiaceae bacterium]